MATGPVGSVSVATSQGEAGTPPANQDLSLPPVGSLEFVAIACGQTHEIDSSRPLSEVVDALDRHVDAIGVIVTDSGQFVGTLSRESVARFLSKPYTQFLYLHRPIAHMLGKWSSPPLECAHDMNVSDVIALALGRPVEERYEPVVALGPDGERWIVDVHNLLLQQNHILESTLASLEQQRAATAKVEREREALHAQLLEASRDAGRAEVATS